MTGGNHLVWGPPNSFIAANNAIGVAMLMAMPLMRYLQIHADKTWVKGGLLACICLSAFAVLGTYSRGAFLAGGVMVIFLAMKSRRRLLFVPALLLASVLAFFFMPERWTARMVTIGYYEYDSSARGRLDSWDFAIRVAVNKPLTGGGFNVFWDRKVWDQYAPELDTRGLGAHSIFFEVVGEHGFIGLIFALLIGLTAWYTCWRVTRLAGRRPDLSWARDLALMLQVSLVGFAAGGAFLNKALFDLYYVCLVLIIAIHEMVKAEVRKPQDAALPEERLAEPGLAARIPAPLREF